MSIAKMPVVIQDATDAPGGLVRTATFGECVDAVPAVVLSVIEAETGYRART